MARQRDNSARKAKAKKRASAAKRMQQNNRVAIKRYKEERLKRKKGLDDAYTDEYTETNTEIAASVLLSFGFVMNDVALRISDMIKTSCDSEKRGKYGTLRDYWTGNKVNQMIQKTLYKAQKEYLRKSDICFCHVVKGLLGKKTLEELQMSFSDMQDECEKWFNPLIKALHKSCRRQIKNIVSYNDIPVVTELMKYKCLTIITKQLYNFFATEQFNSSLSYYSEFDFLKGRLHCNAVDVALEQFKVMDKDNECVMKVDYGCVANSPEVLQCQCDLINMGFSTAFADAVIKARDGQDLGLKEMDGETCLPGGAKMSVVSDESRSRVVAVRSEYTLKGVRMRNGLRTIPCCYIRSGETVPAVFFSSIKDASEYFKVSESSVRRCLYNHRKDGSRCTLKGGDYFILISELRYTDVVVSKVS